jgi:hypothetical protein
MARGSGGWFGSGTLLKAQWLLSLCLLASSLMLRAHDSRVGDMRIEHPFATPSAGAMGSAYLKRLQNTGKQPDRLLGASTPVAVRVELQAETVDGDGIARMQTVPDILLAAGAELKMRPGQGARLQLLGLRQPLREGDTFPLTLEFDRGGKVEVKVYVQTPR